MPDTPPDGHVPARMLNEFAYCPRLAYLEWVQGEWADNPDTLDGKFVHRNVDREDRRPVPQADGEELPALHARSVRLEDAALGLVAVVDLLELDGGSVTPIDYKRGHAPDVPEGAWEPERVQLCAQGLLLRAAGYTCAEGVLYFSASKRRVTIPFDDALVSRTLSLLTEFRRVVAAGTIPPPLEDSPKCPRCSLVTLCLPDETNLLRFGLPVLPADDTREKPPGTGKVRALLAPNDDARPLSVAEPGARVGKSGERLTVFLKEEKLAEARLSDVSHLALFGPVQISAQALSELADRDIPVLHFTTGGWFRSMTAGLCHRNVELRIRQFAAAADPAVAVKLVVHDGDVGKGQNVWQAMGGMEVGSIWGHGSYVAPDWSADWLHRECVFILDAWARTDFKKGYDQIEPEQQAALQKRLERLMRTNTFDPATRTVAVDPVRVRAFEANLRHYADVFGNGTPAYAIPKGAQSDPEKLRQLAAFFFWTSWAASTNRPGADLTYTSNWPHEPLVGNRPTGEAVVWTGVSVLVLLAGIGAMVLWYASQPKERPTEPVPETDPILGWQATPSQRATVKYFWLVSAMILVQILLGVVTAHYGVEGDGFYGVPLSKWLPYSVTRTWHLQLGMLWIATAWLAAGLFIGPLVSGSEPRGQKLGVDLLFVALVVVVVGSMAGQWLSVWHHLSPSASFYFGHQGYEYIDLGRAWQIGLFAGLLLWLFLVVRVVVPALKKSGEQRHLLLLFLMASTAIGLFYGAGLTWGQHTHLTIVEYWRW